MVGGVDHAEEHRLAPHLAGEDLVSGRQLLGRELQGVRLHLAHVRRGDAVGPRERLPKPLLGDEAELVEARPQAPPVEDLVLDGLLKLSLGDHPAVAQDAGQDWQW